MRTQPKRTIRSVCLVVLSLFIISGSHAFSQESVPDAAGASQATSGLGPESRPVGVEATLAEAGAFGDVDGDGDLDLAIGTEVDANTRNVSARIYQNDGAGNYAIAWETTSPKGTTTAVAFADFDGDGDLDLAVVGRDDRPNEIYENQGNYAFVSRWRSSTNRTSNDMAVGDLTGDGRMDVVVANDESGQLYTNQGNWGFAERDILAAGARAVALGDLDNDGWLDIAAAHNGPNIAYFNNRNGTVHASAIQSSIPSQVFEFVLNSRDIAIADFDGNGRPDLAVANADSSFPVQIFFNNPSGWTPQQLSSLEWSSRSLAIGDVDGDGRLDVVTLENAYFQQSSGSFSRETLATSDLNGQQVALADVDQDGDLDYLLVTSSLAPQMDRIFVNHGHLPNRRAWESGIEEVTIAAAFGDFDGDKDLDLATVSDCNGRTRLYENVNGTLRQDNSYGWQSSDTPCSLSTAWGDMDGDGDLDLAVGNRSANQIYENHNGTLRIGGGYGWTSPDSQPTSALAWGDIDSDGDLDLAIANGWASEIMTSSGPNQLYINDGNGNFSVRQLGGPDLSSTSLAFGDMDNDGDLDLLVGNDGNYYDGEVNQLFRNDGRGNFTLDWQSPDRAETRSLALADFDGDGDLDAAIGNSMQQFCTYETSGGINQLYSNNGDGSFQVRALGDENRLTQAIVAGDLDGDGDVDILAGNGGYFSSDSYLYTQRDLVYLNNGTGEFVAQDSEELIGTQYSLTGGLALGDVDQDGDLDWFRASYTRWKRTNPATCLSIGHKDALYLNRTGASDRSPTLPGLAVIGPNNSAWATGYTSPHLLSDRVISVPYRLINQSTSTLGPIDAYYSTNGGGLWQRARGAFDGSNFLWDTFATGFFGESHNVVLRVVGRPPLASPTQPNTYFYPRQLAGPYQYAESGSTTFPFAVQGTQVRVLQNGAGVANALVYRIPAGQNSGGLMASESGAAFRTDHRGYLGGRGRIDIGDRLAALVPITHTRAYTVYYTSAATTPTGLDAFTVAEPGVQELTVSTDNPLLLFNLTVSLEWDARKDATYLAQLEGDLQRASELLFDATNGQAALRDVTIYHAKERWEEADLRIHATNRLRPHALIGGSVDGLTGVNLTDPEVQVAFAPGHIEMPASWNRFGESSGSLGEDWPRALAHEFGHYYFFLLEDYLGMDEANRPVAVTTCPSLMGNVYLDENSEFHPAASWRDGGYACRQTLQHQTLGRSDWEMITTIYPWLKAPASAYSGQNPGPSTLPLAVTQIRHIAPAGPPLTLDVPAYYLVHPDGSRYSASSAARAFRFYGGNLSDLGEPRQDRLQAWGGQTGQGERVCVYDVNPEKSAVGCTAVQNGVSQLVMQPQTGWLPDIQLSPVSTNTLAVRVGNVPDDEPALRIQLFDTSRALTTTAPAEIPLAYDDATGLYTTTIPLHLSAYLRLWDGKVPGRELVTDFSVSGSPGIQLGGAVRLLLGPGSRYTTNGETHAVPEGSTLVIGNGTTMEIGNGTARVLGDGATLEIGNGTTLEIGNGTTLEIGNGTALEIGNGTTLEIGNGTALLIGNGATLLIGNGTTMEIGNGTTLEIGNGTAQLLPSGNGPVLSSDGQVILYVDSLAFAPGHYYTLQPATRVENPPVWATVVGQPYRLSASPGAPAIAGSSLSFRYLGRDVPPGEERFLKVFYFEESSGQWTPLETTLDTVQNAAAAVAQGPGLYVLMSTIPIPLHNPGWNLIAWPVQSSRAVTESLASIAGSYRGLYGYNTGDPDPWRFFSPDPAIPDLLDSLAVLEFGRGYWIYNTEPVTLYLRGGGGEIRLADPRQTATIPEPPTTLYGEVVGGEVAPGVAVWAWIDGVRCGEGRTGEQNGVAVYGLHLSPPRQAEGCGQPGRTVTLALGGRMVDTGWQWAEGLHSVPLRLDAPPRLFLPQLNNGTP